MRKSNHPKFIDHEPTISSDVPFSLVPMAVASDRRLSALEVTALMVLFSFKSKDSDLVFPSRRVIAEAICCEKQYVSKVTGKLEALGWLKKEENTGAFSRACRYFLRIPFDRINADREKRGLQPLPRTKAETKERNREEAEWIADMMPGMEGNGWLSSRDKKALAEFREWRDSEQEDESTPPVETQKILPDAGIPGGPEVHSRGCTGRQSPECTAEHPQRTDQFKNKPKGTNQKNNTQPAEPVATHACARDGADAPIVPDTKPEKKPASGKSKAAASQKPSDVSDEVWQAFQTQRRAKRAPVTPIVIEGLRREAFKAGISLEDAMRTCCERGWQGFRAEWIDRDGRGGSHGVPAANGSREAMLHRLEASRSCTVNDLDYSEGVDGHGFLL